jgi:Swt1-like HEPN
VEFDVHGALKEAENSLRDFIANSLEERFGSEWVDKCGVPPARIEKWWERKEAEVKRQQTGAVEERLLYYADFYDLSTILKKHWSDGNVGFSDALGGKWKTMEIFLDELEKLRDPHAHQRELLPHQKHLILGLSGEIRNRLIRYRSKMETSEDYYPRFESARDNLGTVWLPGRSSGNTGDRLRVGDTLEFVVSATDPMGETLSYKIRKLYNQDDGWFENWQEDNVLRVSITPEDVRKDFQVAIYMRSPRPYHAEGAHDGVVSFVYEVLPPKYPG